MLVLVLTQQSAFRASAPMGSGLYRDLSLTWFIIWWCWSYFLINNLQVLPACKIFRWLIFISDSPSSSRLFCPCHHHHPILLALESYFCLIHRAFSLVPDLQYHLKRVHRYSSFEQYAWVVQLWRSWSPAKRKGLQGKRAEIRSSNVKYDYQSRIKLWMKKWWLPFFLFIFGRWRWKKGGLMTMSEPNLGRSVWTYRPLFLNLGRKL